MSINTKAVRNALEFYKNNIGGYDSTYVSGDDALSLINWVHQCLDEIDRLRSQLEWLPYPANKPESWGEYLVTASDGECHGDDLIFPVFYIAEKDKWNLEDEGLSHLIVTAYRPLPEAYKPEEEK